MIIHKTCFLCIYPDSIKTEPMKYILKQVESQKTSKLRSETELKYYNILFYMPPPEIVKT